MNDRTELRRYRVSGRVQGVGFRWWTQKVASELQLVGRVKNESDGTVDVRAEGTPQALDRLEEALRDGPPAARVESVRAEKLARGTVDGEGDRWNGFAIDR